MPNGKWIILTLHNFLQLKHFATGWKEMGEFVCRSSVSIMLELSWFHFTTIKSSSLKRIHIAINVNECSLIVMSTSLCVCSSRAPHTKKKSTEKKITPNKHTTVHILFGGAHSLEGYSSLPHFLLFTSLFEMLLPLSFRVSFFETEKKNQINTTLVNTLSPSKPKNNGKKVVSLKTHPKYRTQKSTRWIVGN